jgi:protein YibB
MVITTALFDLDRTNWTNYNRSIQDYKSYNNMVYLKCNMVIYTTEDLKPYFEDKRKEIDPDLTMTKIITMKLEEIPYYDYLDKLTEVMKSDFFIKNVKMRHDIYRPEANYPIYNIIQFAKSKFVENTIRKNFFNSEHHCWMDAGIYHHLFSPNWIKKEFPLRNQEVLEDGKIHQFYIDFPRESDLNKVDYYGQTDDVRIAGGWFGGGKSALLKFSEIVKKVVDDSIIDGVISDDQNIYTISYLENKNLFTLHNGVEITKETSMKTGYGLHKCFAALDFFIGPYC